MILAVTMRMRIWSTTVLVHGRASALAMELLVSGCKQSRAKLRDHRSCFLPTNLANSGSVKLNDRFEAKLKMMDSAIAQKSRAQLWYPMESGKRRSNIHFTMHTIRGAGLAQYPTHTNKQMSPRACKHHIHSC